MGGNEPLSARGASLIMRSPGRAIGAEAFLDSQDRHRELQALLPEETLHRDVERLILYGQLIDVIVVRGMVVHRPARSGQHQISRFPLIDLALDRRAPGAVEIVIDCRRSV